MTADPMPSDAYSLSILDEGAIIFGITKDGGVIGDIDAALIGLQRDQPSNPCLPFLRALHAARREADARVAAAYKEGWLFNASGAGSGSISETYLLQRMDACWKHSEAAKSSIPNPLTTLLAEAREAGRMEMREMAAKAVNVTLSPHGMGGMTPEEAEEASIRQLCAGIIRALPVKIPTPEAPRDDI